MKYRKFVFIVLVLSPLFVMANAAQPGLWQAGGTATFSLLYPDDSASYKKIQMVRERVYAQLYDGYAVVKGQYWMYNDTEDSVRIRTGYPINSLLDRGYGGLNADLEFDDLYKLKVYSNSNQMALLRDTITNPNASWSEDNWYVWWNDFAPGDTTLIEVYFIVNTSNAKLNRGYAKDYVNGFVYILETGATWKQPINSGEIIIQVMPEIALKDIRGIVPDSLFQFDSSEQIFFTSFTKKSPGPDDNIVITYDKHLVEFDFSQVISRSEELFLKVGVLEFQWLNAKELPIENFGDPFKVQSADSFSRILQVLIVLVIAVPIVLILFLAYFIWTRVKRKRALAKSDSN